MHVEVDADILIARTTVLRRVHAPRIELGRKQGSGCGAEVAAERRSLANCGSLLVESWRTHLDDAVDESMKPTLSPSLIRSVEGSGDVLLRSR
jgi:hypothetical protein